MAHYAIMRCKKLASMGCAASALQHCHRERDTPNADPAQTPSNEHRGAKSTDQAMGQLRELLPEKRRKDAVVAVEYMFSASPEWWKKATPDQQRAFFDKAQKWLGDKYGPDRIITATVHRDETSPHLSAFVVPLTKDGRLSAKEFIGNAGKLRADQSSFAESVKELGLERGIEGSRANHQRVKSFYSAIEQQRGHVTISPTALEPQTVEKKLFSRKVETPEAVAQRLTAGVRKVYEPTMQAAATAHSDRQKAQQAEATAKALRDRLQPVVEALASLPRDLHQKAFEVFGIICERLKEQRREEQQRQRELREQARPAGRSRDDGGMER
jgi:hypothetical protein